MVREVNEAFDDIFYCQPVGPGRDTFSRQFVCSPHQEFVCGTCCMDFALLNELRYDKEYMVLAASPHKRMERIRRVVNFYFMNPRAEFQRDPSKRRSPRLERLLNEFAENKDVSVAKVIELAAYLSYICRSDASARKRICTTLDTVLLEEIQTTSKGQEGQETNSVNSSEVSSDSGIPAPMSESKDEKSSSLTLSSHKIHDTAKGVLSKEIVELVEEYMLPFKQCKSMLKREGVTSFGQFFNDFKKVARDGDERAWTRFLRTHAKIGEAPLNNNPEDWSTTRLQQFLDQQGLALSPRPSKAAMVETARKLLHFSASCKHVLYHYSIVKSDDRKENALGSCNSNCNVVTPKKVKALWRKSMKVAALPKPSLWTVQKPGFLVEPQIPAEVCLSETVSWDRLGKIVKCHPFFVRNRIAYTKAFPLDNAFHRTLDTLELVADTYDRALESHPPQDFIIVLTSKDNKGTEVSLAIRCLGASNFGTSKSPIPVLHLEYLAAEHNPSSVEYQSLSNGVRPGVTRFINETCEKKDLDLLLLMLQTNGKHLQEKDVRQNYVMKLSPSWNFSVVRGADPVRRGVFPLCPCCEKRAAMMCSACREVSYCSRDCQVEDWSSHYKVCKPCETTVEMESS